jgi:actin-like ATPase involved in cell morphogenesis
MHAVGIDIGTTYTAAAVWRDGRAEIASLGSHSAAIPSVVFVRADGSVLTGESAGRRGLSEPNRVARRFRQQLGAATPTLLGGAPYSGVALMARMLRSVLDTVAGREGGPPESICLSHPAGWGPYQLDLLRQVIRLADVEQPVQLIAEPLAAATFHAHQKGLRPGAVVAVYDLGGYTFDASVLRKTADGFDFAGRAETVEGLGGTDFDARILAHVLASAATPEPAGHDPAIERLRAECTAAKEALSTDTDAMIPVLLPNLSTEVRLTRTELEEMVRPAVAETAETLLRVVRSGGYAPGGLGSVLLIGGSSRMPIVARTVGEELGLPVAVDANPKLSVALGAACHAGGTLAGTASEPADPRGATPAVPLLTGVPANPAPVVPAPVVPAPVVPAPVVPAPVVPAPVVAAPVVAAPVVPAPAAATDADDEPTGEIPLAAAPGPQPGGPPLPKAGFAGRVTIGAAGAVPVSPALPPMPPAAPANRWVPALLGAATVLLLAVSGTVWLLARSNDRDTARAVTGQQQSTPASSAPAAAPAPVVPPDEQCTDELKKSTRWVCLTKATLRGNTFTVYYEAEWNGSKPDIGKGFHLHMYGGDGTKPDESTMGSQAVRHSKYYFEDREPSVRRTTDSDFTAIGDAGKVCARIAQVGHGLAKAADGTYHTGNCIPIERD